MNEEKDKELELERLMGKIRTINSLLRNYPDDIHIGVKKKEPPVSFIDDRPVYTEVYVSLEKEIAEKFLKEYRTAIMDKVEDLFNQIHKKKRVICREFSLYNNETLALLHEELKYQGKHIK